MTLADRVNYCLTRSLAGNALPHDSREMEDILAYLAFLSRGIPVGHRSASADGLIPMKDTLLGDTARGRALFETTCTLCHGPGGAGVAPFPDCGDHARFPSARRWRARSARPASSFTTCRNPSRDRSAPSRRSISRHSLTPNRGPTRRGKRMTGRTAEPRATYRIRPTGTEPSIRPRHWYPGKTPRAQLCRPPRQPGATTEKG